MFFIILRKYAKNMGIAELAPGQTNPFNRRTAIVATIFLIYLLSSTAYLLLDANTFRDYTMCFYIWVTLLFVFFGYLIMIVKAQDMFKLSKFMEQLIENGKKNVEWLRKLKKKKLIEFLVEIESDNPISTYLYKTTNEKIEFWTKFVHIFFVKCVVPFGGTPLIGVSYYNYYVRDMGRDSFYLFQCTVKRKE